MVVCNWESKAMHLLCFAQPLHIHTRLGQYNKLPMNKRSWFYRKSFILKGTLEFVYSFHLNIYTITAYAKFKNSSKLHVFLFHRFPTLDLTSPSICTFSLPPPPQSSPTSHTSTPSCSPLTFTWPSPDLDPEVSLVVARGQLEAPPAGPEAV